MEALTVGKFRGVYLSIGIPMISAIDFKSIKNTEKISNLIRRSNQVGMGWAGIDDAIYTVSSVAL